MQRIFFIQTILIDHVKECYNKHEMTTYIYSDFLTYHENHPFLLSKEIINHKKNPIFSYLLICHVKIVPIRSDILIYLLKNSHKETTGIECGGYIAEIYRIYCMDIQDILQGYIKYNDPFLFTLHLKARNWHHTTFMILRTSTCRCSMNRWRPTSIGTRVISHSNTLSTPAVTREHPLQSVVLIQGTAIHSRGRYPCLTSPH